MKHLTKVDLYMLVKLVNEHRSLLEHAADLTEMAHRQDREHKSLPPLTIDEQAALTEPMREALRRMFVLRVRLLRESAES